MGDRPRPYRSSGLHLLLRLLSVVAALAVLCISQRASAASANAPIPMCGEHNESIAAPPIFRAYRGGSIASSPCQPDELAVGHSAPPAPERVVVQERPERVLGFGALRLSQSQSCRVSIEGASAEPEHAGFVDLPFRPPRA